MAKKIVELDETLKEFVILSEAKDLLSRALARRQVFRFAQDDKQVRK
ncbi:MAG: hypothetical protein LAO30_05405 [Acidobacteriia bacterium]|nr:hypothetical protein [Terriglobia bacterium]